MRNRTYHVVFGCAVAGFVLSGYSTVASAALLAYEPFNYPPGDITDSTAVTGTGFTGNWARLIDNLPDYGAVTAGSLTYPNGASQDNKLENGHNRLSAQLDTSVAGPFAAHRDLAGNVGLDGTTLYLGFLMKLNPAPTSGFVAFELFRDSDADNPGRRLSVDVWTSGPGHPGGAANIWLTGWTGGGTVVDADPILANNNTATHLFVLKINFGAANADTVDVYVDPNIPAGEPGSPTASISVTDLSFDRFLTSNFANTVITADEVRFGTTYADVLPVPEPSALGLCLAASAAALLRRRRV